MSDYCKWEMGELFEESSHCLLLKTKEVSFLVFGMIIMSNINLNNLFKTSFSVQTL